MRADSSNKDSKMTVVKNLHGVRTVYRGEGRNVKQNEVNKTNLRVQINQTEKTLTTATSSIHHRHSTGIISNQIFNEWLFAIIHFVFAAL